MPPKNYQGRSIDFAYDEPNIRQVSTETLKLVQLLTRLFFTEDVFRNLADCAWDNFCTITDRMPVNFIEACDYVNEVLDWAFAALGRGAYDRIKEVCEYSLRTEAFNQKHPREIPE